MPPPMPNPTKRMTANPARPIGRYRPGKAVHEEDSSDEESDDEEAKPQERIQSRPRNQITRPSTTLAQPEEEDDEEGFVTEEEDAGPTIHAKSSALSAAQSTVAVPPTTVSRPLTTSKTDASSEAGSDEEEEEEEEEEEGDEDDSEDETESSSSEEEAPQRRFQRPTFIKKSDRQALASTNSEDAAPLSAASTLESSDQLRRKAQADLLIKDKLEKDLLARAAGKKAWDDDDELDPEATVDDTDNLDPEAEYKAWVLRELRRVKRDKEAIEASEREIEEKERRRNLTAAEREREDQEYLEKQKAERDEGRSAATYMARYHHKGAFFQDDEAAEILKKRDIMGARFADDVTDKSTLPEYMRVRDMTKLGKKGRTRYTDLKGQDTGRFGEEVKRWRGAGDQGRGGDGRNGAAGGGDMRGIDERFLPDHDDRSRGPTGANASAVGTRPDVSASRRRWGSRSRSRSRSPRRRGRDHDDNSDDAYHGSRRRRRRSYSLSASRSRSRSPPVRERGKRRHSPDDGRDKRIRIET